MNARIAAPQHRPEREQPEQQQRRCEEEPRAHGLAGQSARHGRCASAPWLPSADAASMPAARNRYGLFAALGQARSGASLLFQNATASSSAVLTSLRPMIAASTASCSRLFSRSKPGTPAT